MLEGPRHSYEPVDQRLGACGAGQGERPSHQAQYARYGIKAAAKACPGDAPWAPKSDVTATIDHQGI